MKMYIAILSLIACCIDEINNRSFAGDKIINSIGDITSKPNTSDSNTLFIYGILIVLILLILAIINFKDFKNKLNKNKTTNEDSSRLDEEEK